MSDLPASTMHLKVLLPFGVFADCPGVSRIVAETPQGSVGFWPHRLDCVTALAQGILGYTAADGEEVFVAVDSGVLVKAGAAVTVSVRRAVAGTDLGRLHETLEREFATLDAQQQGARLAMQRVEADVLRRFVAMRHV